MIPLVTTEYDLHFSSLLSRDDTDMVVIHHTGDEVDDDLSAQQIHAIHINQGWSGIGYHFVIRKNGSVEVGRPLWAVGAHAVGDNWHSVGIHVCGNFEIAEPNEYQIESLAYLVAYVCDNYDIPIDADHVVGHCDLMATACPGRNLYSILQTIRGKAVWYKQHYSCMEGD